MLSSRMAVNPCSILHYSIFLTGKNETIKKTGPLDEVCECGVLSNFHCRDNYLPPQQGRENRIYLEWCHFHSRW